MRLRIVFGSDEVAQTIRPVRIRKQRVEGGADNRVIAPMLFERIQVGSETIMAFEQVE